MRPIYFILFIFFLLTACAAPPADNSTRDYVTGNDEPIIIVDPTSDTEPDTPSADIQFAVKISDNLYLSTFEEMFLAGTGKVNRVASRSFSINDELIEFDQYGAETSSLMLAFTPAAIKQTEAGLFYIKEIPPADAYAMGGLYRIYSEIYKDHIEISPWYLNQWQVSGIVSAGSEVYAIDINNAFHKLNGAYSGIIHVEPGAFIMHSWDSINRLIEFDANIETYSTNNILNAKNWQLSDPTADGLYYSENGFTWSESEGLSEAVTSLWGFTSSPYPVELPNGQAPVLMSAGKAGGALYWIECNSGWVFEYWPETDVLIKKWRIYDGDGLHSTGIVMRSELKPVMITTETGAAEKGILFFRNDGSIYKLEIETGFINIFYAGNGEVMLW